MKYLVYGAGGTGGCLAAFLAMSGKDVSLIARGAHRDAIEENGLVLETVSRATLWRASSPLWSGCAARRPS